MNNEDPLPIILEFLKEFETAEQEYNNNLTNAEQTLIEERNKLEEDFSQQQDQINSEKTEIEQKINKKRQEIEDTLNQSRQKATEHVKYATEAWKVAQLELNQDDFETEAAILANALNSNPMVELANKSILINELVAHIEHDISNPPKNQKSKFSFLTWKRLLFLLIFIIIILAITALVIIAYYTGPHTWTITI